MVELRLPQSIAFSLLEVGKINAVRTFRRKTQETDKQSVSFVLRRNESRLCETLTDSEEQLRVTMYHIGSAINLHCGKIITANRKIYKSHARQVTTQTLMDVHGRKEDTRESTKPRVGGRCGIRTHGSLRNHWFSRPAP